MSCDGHKILELKVRGGSKKPVKTWKWQVVEYCIGIVL